MENLKPACCCDLSQAYAGISFLKPLESATSYDSSEGYSGFLVFQTLSKARPAPSHIAELFRCLPV